jgi:hypothetical protein
MIDCFYDLEKLGNFSGSLENVAFKVFLNYCTCLSLFVHHRLQGPPSCLTSWVLSLFALSENLRVCQICGTLKNRFEDQRSLHCSQLKRLCPWNAPKEGHKFSKSPLSDNFSLVFT